MKKQVKIISALDCQSLEDSINEVLSNTIKKVIDIKYCTEFSFLPHTNLGENIEKHFAMIIYEVE